MSTSRTSRKTERFNEIWETKDGDVLFVHEMEHYHVKNVLKFMIRKYTQELETMGVRMGKRPKTHDLCGIIDNMSDYQAREALCDHIRNPKKLKTIMFEQIFPNEKHIIQTLRNT